MKLLVGVRKIIVKTEENARDMEDVFAKLHFLETNVKHNKTIFALNWKINSSVVEKALVTKLLDVNAMRATKESIVKSKKLIV